MITRRALTLLLALLALPALAADDRLKPFVLAWRGAGEPAVVVADVRAKLGAAGFEVAGSYQPYPGATVLVVTSGLLKGAAAAVPGASYGAAQRVTVTKVGEEVQVAFTSPTYMQFAYRMKTDLSGPERKLSEAIGRLEAYGPSVCKTP